MLTKWEELNKKGFSCLAAGGQFICKDTAFLFLFGNDFYNYCSDEHIFHEKCIHININPLFHLVHFFLWIKSSIIWEHQPSKYSFRHLQALSASSQFLPSTVWTEVNQRSREHLCQDYVVLSSFTAKNPHFLYDGVSTAQHMGLGTTTAGASDPLHPCDMGCRHSVLRTQHSGHLLAASPPPLSEGLSSRFETLLLWEVVPHRDSHSQY